MHCLLCSRQKSHYGWRLVSGVQFTVKMPIVSPGPIYMNYSWRNIRNASQINSVKFNGTTDCSLHNDHETITWSRFNKNVIIFMNLGFIARLLCDTAIVWSLHDKMASECVLTACSFVHLSLSLSLSQYEQVHENKSLCSKTAYHLINCPPMIDSCG